MKTIYSIVICFLLLNTLSVKLYAQVDSLLGEFIKTPKTTDNILKLISITKELCDYNVDSALNCAYSIQKIKIPETNSDLECKMLINLGTITKFSGKYSEANTYLNQALEIAEKKDLFSLQIISLYQIGDLSRCLSLLDQSLQYLYLSRNLAYKYQLSNQHPQIYDRISSTYYQLAANNFARWENMIIPDQHDIGTGKKTPKDYIKFCKLYADSALFYSKQNNDNRTILSSLNLLGVYFRYQKNYNKAIEYFNKALDLSIQTGLKSNLPNYYANISKVYFNLKNYNKAIETGLAGYKIADELNILAYKLLLAHTIRISYAEIKDFERALEYSIIESNTHNDIFDKQTWTQINELSKKYQTEKKEKEIAHQQELLELKNAEVFKLNVIIVILLVVFAVIVAGSIYIQKQKKRIRVQAEKISEQYANMQKLSSFKESLTQALVHDLKNPLSQILINTDNPNIRFATNKMLRLVMNLLDVEKYDTTQFVINKEIHSLTDVLNEVKKDQILSMDEKNVKLNFRFIDYFITADKEIIIRILDNLLSNAIRFSPLNSQIDIFADTNNDKTVQIGIKNYGQKIAEEELPHIFDRYRHFGKNNNSSWHSTGLGLTFCKMAIEAHGQKISAHNETDGVLFSFSLEGKNSNKQKKVHREKESDINLSKYEIQILQSWFQELQSIDVSHISDIHRIINQIPDKSENIVNIKKQICNAAFSSNAELFNRLTNIR